MSTPRQPTGTGGPEAPTATALPGQRLPGHRAPDAAAPRRRHGGRRMSAIGAALRARAVGIPVERRLVAIYTIAAVYAGPPGLGIFEASPTWG